MTRRFVFLPALAVAVAVFAVAAGAAWLASGTGSSSSRSTSLGMPTAVSASATGSTSIRVTWNAPATPSPAPTTYDVFRYVGGTGTKICSAVSATATLVCNDSGLSPSTSYGYSVEARLGANWMSGQTPLVSATTEAAPVGTPTFLVELVTPGNQTAGTVPVRLTARNGTVTDTTYGGAHTIGFSGPGTAPDGSAPTASSNVTFTAGVGTTNLTLPKAEVTTLTATEGVRTGSTSVTVVAAPAAALQFSSSFTVTGGQTTQVPVNCANGCTVSVNNDGTFTSKVTRVDQYENPAIGTALTVNLTRDNTSRNTLSPTSLTIASGASTTAGTFTVTLANGNPDVLVTAGPATPGTLTSVAVRVKK